MEQRQVKELNKSSGFDATAYNMSVSVVELATIKTLLDSSIKLSKGYVDNPESMGARDDFQDSLQETWKGILAKQQKLRERLVKYTKGCLGVGSSFERLSFIFDAEDFHNLNTELSVNDLVKPFYQDTTKEYFVSFRSICKKRNIKIPSKLLSLTRKRS